MSSKTEIIQQFIASGEADFAEANSSNSYYCSHHPSITPLVKKPPKELDDATLQAFYYYLLLNGGTPPAASEHHLQLLFRAARDAAGCWPSTVTRAAASIAGKWSCCSTAR